MKSSSQVITKFPAEDLLVAGSKYHAVGADLLRCGTRSPTSTPQPAMGPERHRRRDFTTIVMPENRLGGPRKITRSRDVTSHTAEARSVVIQADLV